MKLNRIFFKNLLDIQRHLNWVCTTSGKRLLWSEEAESATALRHNKHKRESESKWKFISTNTTRANWENEENPEKLLLNRLAPKILFLWKFSRIFISFFLCTFSTVFYLLLWISFSFCFETSLFHVLHDFYSLKANCVISSESLFIHYWVSLFAQFMIKFSFLCFNSYVEMVCK
jgi:hypothetical protein